MLLTMNVSNYDRNSTNGGGSPCVVEANVQDVDIVESEFKHA